MSNINDIKFAAVAKSILAKMGVNGQIITSTEGDYDVSTGTVATTELTSTIRMSPPLSYSSREVNETTVLNGDLKVITENVSGVIPKAGDQVDVSGIKCNIKTVKSIYSGDDIAVYILQCSKVV